MGKDVKRHSTSSSVPFFVGYCLTRKMIIGKIEEMLLVTSTGAKVLSKYPVDEIIVVP
jgi:hypothetical protein